MNTDLQKRWNRWLSRRRGQHIRAEEFHHAVASEVPCEDWQRVMSGLISSARAQGRIKSSGLVRDRFGSWKARWNVVA